MWALHTRILNIYDDIGVNYAKLAATEMFGFTKWGRVVRIGCV